MDNITTGKKQGISIVVPFFNEEEGLPIFCQTMDSYAKSLDFPVEIIFVNDGSVDQSENVLRSFSFQNIQKTKLVTLSRNFGSHAAIRAGLTQTSFDICTWMGSDLQEPLEMIPRGYFLIQEGYDAVYVEKKTVQVSKANRLFSKTYSYLMRKYAVKSYASGGISTIIFNKKIRDYLNNNIETNSSVMLQIMDAGFKNTTISLNFHERSAGLSKWTLEKKIKLFVDSFVAFSFAPIRLVSITGICIFFVGMILGILVIVNKLINPDTPVGYSTLASILALGFGVTNMSLGIIAEYLWRTYDAARNRSCFLISQVADLNENKEKSA